jgi:hypothetical protein
MSNSLSGALRCAAVLMVLVCSVASSAQNGEFGAAFGYGFYRNGTIIAPAGQATAGIRNRFVVGVVLADDLYEHLTGELRYTYHDGDPFLQAHGAKTNLQGQSHSFHYDLLFQTRPRSEKIRPYVAAGLGAKLYVISGPAALSPPLTNIGVLRTTDEAKALVSAGAGVKIRMRQNIVLRFDFRDYITTFPRQQIQPARSATARGIFQQFTPMVGISYVF